MKNQKLALEQWRDMPVLLFTSRYQPGGNMGIWRGGIQPNQAFGDVYIEAYDKSTGKLFYKMPTKGEATMGQNYLLVYAINHDVANGKVEMIANNYKLTITQEGETTAAKEGGDKEKGTKPAAQGGQQSTPADVLPARSQPRRPRSSRSDGAPTSPDRPGRGEHWPRRAPGRGAGAFLRRRRPLLAQFP